MGKSGNDFCVLPYLDCSPRPRFRLTYIYPNMSEITQVHPFEVNSVFQLIQSIYFWPYGGTHSILWSTKALRRWIDNLSLEARAKIRYVELHSEASLTSREAEYLKWKKKSDGSWNYQVTRMFREFTSLKELHIDIRVFLDDIGRFTQCEPFIFLTTLYISMLEFVQLRIFIRQGPGRSIGNGYEQMNPFQQLLWA